MSVVAPRLLLVRITSSFRILRDENDPPHTPGGESRPPDPHLLN